MDTVITVTLNPALDKTVHVPSLEVGGLNRIKQARTDPGGKGINVAKVLKHYAVPVCVSGLTAGRQGDHFVANLKAEGFVTEFLTVAGELRTNMKIYDESTRITTELNEAGFYVTADDISNYEHLLAKRLQKASMLVLGGSLPPGVAKDIYAQLIQAAHQEGVRVVLDADGKALREGIRARPFAVKPNLHELQQWAGKLLPEEEDIIEAGRSIIEQGVSVVLVSLGSEGAVLLNENEVYRVRPFAIEAQSTVGAGDSMVATLVYAVLKDFSMAETAAWTSAAGTVTASKPGTQVCLLSEVREAVGRVHVTKRNQSYA